MKTPRAAATYRAARRNECFDAKILWPGPRRSFYERFNTSALKRRPFTGLIWPNKRRALRRPHEAR